MTTKSVESVCVFGSAARNEQDTYSDKDILIITSNALRQKQLCDEWSAGGWSVASYSAQRFESLIKSGSLFVEHIKSEGKIIVDKDHWLQKALERAIPKSSYASDLDCSLTLIAPLARIPRNFWTYFLFADISYVFIRNASILWLADRGCYKFGIQDLLSSLNEFGFLTLQEAETIRQLRIAKNYYRNRVIADPTFDLEEVKIICNKFCGGRISLEQIYTPYIRDLSFGYATLRDAEACLLDSFSPIELDKATRAHAFYDLWRQVRNPRSYAWAVKNIDRDWIRKWNSRFAASEMKRNVA